MSRYHVSFGRPGATNALMDRLMVEAIFWSAVILLAFGVRWVVRDWLDWL